MKKKFGKFLSILLTAVMLVGMLPATAFASGRTEISNVVVETDSGDITPEYGDEAADPVFTTTEGKPAYLDCNNWQKKVGDDWVDMADGDTFNGGTYRYMAQLRIDGKKFDGYDTTTHKLSQGSLTVTVDGKEWDKSGTAYVSGSASFVSVYSQKFTVEAPDSMELTFYDSDAFDIARSYVGKAITSKNVAGNVEGGTKPYTFSKASGPDWINVSEDGKITGTPTPEAVGPNEELVVKVTDSVGDYKTITITVASTKVNPADRTVISVVEVTSDINPMIGKKATAPTFTTTVGKPAYIDTNSWLKQVDGGWTYIGSDATFEEGCTYRYKAQLRIDWEEFDGYDYTTHMLSQESLTLTVDGEAWEVDGTANVDSASFVTVFSPAMVVEKIPVLALDIKGIAAPVEGATADVSGITINNNTSATVRSAKWLKEGRLDMEEMSASDQFEGGKTYYLRIQYELAEAYKLSDNPQIQHDLTGGEAVHEPSVQTIVITYTVPETYTVTVTTDGNGTASASPAKAAAGTTVTLTATPNEGYEFVEWEVPAHSDIRFIDKNSFIMPEHDVVVKASFKAKATVTTIDTINITGITAPVADKSPVTDGITTDTTGVTLKTIQWEKTGGVSMGSSEKFVVGQTYTLYISYEPQSGYEISNTVTVTSDLENSNVNATSASVNIQYTVPEAATYTVAVTDGTARQVTPVDGEYATTIETKAGNRILLKADDKEGKVFTGWSGLEGITLYGDGATVKDDTLQFIMPEKNVTVTANYIDESAETVIKNIDITGITTPLAGATPKVSGITINTERVDYSRAAWNYDGAYLGFDDTFEKGEKYCLYVFLELDEGYSVANDVTITADIDYDNAFVRDNVVYIYYTVKEDAPASYTVTVTTDGNGTVSASHATAEVGTTVTLTAEANEGYEFDRWEVREPAGFVIGGNSFEMPAGNVSVMAIFREKATAPVETYTVTVTTDGNGTASASHATAEAGTTVTLTAEANDGYEFDRWDVTEPADFVIDGNSFEMPAANVAVTAIFKAKAGTPEPVKYKATVENGSGSGEYAAGAEVTITAGSRSGYRFVKWTSDDVTVRNDKDATTAFIMPDKDVTVTAVYEKVSSGSSGGGGSTKYKVTVEDTDNGTVESNRTRASKGTTVTITVDPEAGYEVDDIVVETKAGKEVEVTDKGDGKFTFKMPAANVTVSVDFAKADVEDSDAKDEVEYIQLTIDSVIAWVFDEFVANDVAPVIRNARTMLPARFVSEALCGVVTWDEEAQKVTIVNGEDTIEIFIGEPFATVNGDPVELDSPAFIENDRTYLPIRFIAENMGATVTWDAAERTVTIVPGE